MSEEELRSMEVLALFTQAIWQSTVVAKALESLSIFHSNVLARHLFHFFQLGLGEVWLVVLPAGPKLADVLGSGAHLFLNKVADIHGDVFVPIVIVIEEKIFGNHVLLKAYIEEKIFGNHVLLKAFLGDLTLE